MGNRGQSVSEKRAATIAQLRAQMEAIGSDASLFEDTSSEAHSDDNGSCLSGEAEGDAGRRRSAGSCKGAARGAAPGNRRTVIADESEEEPVDPRKAAYDRIVMLCSYQDFSREKMRQRLKRERVDEAAAEDALDKAVGIGLIDDLRYGEALCAGRMRAGKGRQGIELELWSNHIDPASIEGWPEEYAERFGGEVDRALRLIERHPPHSKRPRDSAYRRLIGKGYSSDAAGQAARIWWAREQEGEEGA